jgi:hypothetical protein
MTELPKGCDPDNCECHSCCPITYVPPCGRSNHSRPVNTGTDAVDEREKVLNELVGNLINYFENEVDGCLRGLPLFSDVEAISPHRLMIWIEELRQQQAKER